MPFAAEIRFIEGKRTAAIDTVLAAVESHDHSPFIERVEQEAAN